MSTNSKIIMNHEPQYICEVKYDNALPTNSYLNTLPVVRYLKKHSIKFSKNVSIFVGENGTGKSTILEAIAVAYGFNPEGGNKNFNFSTNPTHSALYNHLALVKRDYPEDGFFLRAESLYNVATNIDEMDSIIAFSTPVIASYGWVSLHKQSHGESFLAIVQNKFHGRSLYIMDEPEAALSPMSILTLIAEINRLVKDGSQFIISTHSPMLMAFPDAQILELTEKGITEKRYDETEHFRTTLAFLNNPERMLRYLLEDYVEDRKNK